MHTTDRTKLHHEAIQIWLINKNLVNWPLNNLTEMFNGSDKACYIGHTENLLSISPMLLMKLIISLKIGFY